MGRRKIWFIIIGILIAGVFITWKTERFVSSRGVDTAAVVGFEMEKMVPGDTVPLLKKAAALEEKKEVSDSAMPSVAELYKEQKKSIEDRAETVKEVIKETLKSPLDPATADSGQKAEENGNQEYTKEELKAHLETICKEAEKYPDDPSTSQTSRNAAAEYVWNLWDRELNLIYSEIREEMDEEAAKLLRKEEIEWLKKRDLAADKAVSKNSGTPGQNAEYIRILAKETKERCYALLESYGTYLKSED